MHCSAVTLVMSHFWQLLNRCELCHAAETVCIKATPPCSAGSRVLVCNAMVVCLSTG